MLRELRIKNFAVIDEVALELGPGLNIITGETGAGKSIILNALGLVSGERGSSDIIRHKEDEATVEALFDGVPKLIEARLADAGFQLDGELVIKRILNRSGKNRIYLNGSLCPLNLLAEIGGALVHIYGQHEHHSLLQPETHLNLLDAFAEVDSLALAMKQQFAALTAAWNELNETRDSLDKRRRERANLEAQAEEIARAHLKPGEEEELRASKNILTHSEKLNLGCREGEELLYEGDAALVGRLGKYATKLRELAAIDSNLQPTEDLIQSSLAQLQEAAAQLRRYADRIHFDPRALEQLEDRLAEIQRLKRKYQGGVDDILRMEDDIQRTLSRLENSEEQIAALEKNFASARRTAWDGAEKLSHERQRAAKKTAPGARKRGTWFRYGRDCFRCAVLKPGRKTGCAAVFHCRQAAYRARHGSSGILFFIQPRRTGKTVGEDSLRRRIVASYAGAQILGHDTGCGINVVIR